MSEVPPYDPFLEQQPPIAAPRKQPAASPRKEMIQKSLFDCFVRRRRRDETALDPPRPPPAVRMPVVTELREIFSLRTAYCLNEPPRGAELALAMVHFAIEQEEEGADEDEAEDKPEDRCCFCHGDGGLRKCNQPACTVSFHHYCSAEWNGEEGSDYCEKHAP